MAPRLKPGASVTRTVKGSPKTTRAQEIVVTLTATSTGALLELRALRHKQTVVVEVDRLFDDLMWAQAKREAQRGA